MTRIPEGYRRTPLLKPAGGGEARRDHTIDPMTTAEETAPYSGRTAWARSMQTPLREFLRTETGSAAVLLGAAVAALVWVEHRRARRTSASGRRRCRSTSAAHGIALDLRDWVNSGLMTFFFFVVGLEARREFDLGELRERRRSSLPLLAGVGGMAVRGRDLPRVQRRPARPRTAGASRCRPTPRSRSALLALVGPRLPDRLRAFMLTVVVVDDIVALVVIAIVYTERLRARRRCSSRSALFAVVLVAARAAACAAGSLYVAARRGRLGRAARVGRRPGRRRARDGAARPSPTRRRGRTSSARPSASASSASSRRRSSRARPARGSGRAISPNERLQQLYHPWTSYVIVPLFALANAGIAIDGDFLARAFTLADHARHPARLRRRQAGRHPRRRPGWSRALSRGRLRPPVGWAAVAGGGTIAGIGFTVSLLIATLAFDGDAAGGGEARHPRRGAAPRRCSRWLVFRATALLPRRLRIRALLGTRRAARRPRRRRRPGARPHPRPDRRAGHARRVRRLRVPVLRPGRAGRPRAARATSATSATSGGTCR